MIPRELLVVDPAQPDPLIVWQWSILARNAYYSDQTIDRQLASLVGASQTFDIPYEGRVVSVTIIADTENALICIEGTRDASQIVPQVLGSSPQEPPWLLSTPSAQCSTFNLSQALQVSALIEARIPRGKGVTIIGHSLGGAVGAILASQWCTNGYYTVNSLITFGAPREGTAAFDATITCPYLRVWNGNDPIPLIPYSPAITRAVILAGSGGRTSYNYAWAVGSQNITDDIEFATSTAAGDNQRAADGGAFGNPAYPTFATNVSAYHPITQYTLALQGLFSVLGTAAPTVRAWQTPVEALNYLEMSGQGPAPGTPPSPGQLADPNTVVNPTSGALITPVQDRGQTVELWSSRSTLTSGTPSAGLLSGASIMGQMGKVSFRFNCNYLGWSEDYWCAGMSGIAASPANIALARQLANLRMALMGSDTQLVAVRISILNNPTTWPIPPRNAQLVQLNGFTLVGPNGNGGTENPSVALLCKCTPPAGTLAPPKLVYLRGVPDIILRNGTVYDPTLLPGYQANVDLWTNFLSGQVGSTPGAGTGWGWAGRPAPVTSPLIAVTQAGGQVSFVTMAPIFPAGAVTQIVPVRFSKMNRGQAATLTGTHPCRVSALNAAQTTKQIAILPWTNGGQATYANISLIQFGYIAFDRVAARECGRPFGPERGRAPTRITA